MIERVDYPGTEYINNAKTFGRLLSETLASDPSFYLFSPDETTSNRLAEVYNVERRAWNLPIKPWDLPESPHGRIVELLSENVLLSVLLGHLSTGAPGMMTSYESFFSICYAQILQHLKFLRQLFTVSWRDPWPALNLLSTSICWRQDHNGFTHQSPALLSALLSVPDAPVNCLFPVDDASVETTYRFMLSSKNVVNLATFDKNDTPRWIDSSHASFLFDNGGASIYRFASDPDPDLVLTALGDIPTREMLRARDLIKSALPDSRLRFVGLNSLTPGHIGTVENTLKEDVFAEYFGSRRPILAAFHGYPATLKNILSTYTSPSRLTVRGFQEQGTTTTPLEMLSLNHASRFDLAADIANLLGHPALADSFRTKIAENHRYALRYGKDKFSLD